MLTSNYNVQNFLGEGPIWHENRQSLFWVDIENMQLFELDLSSNQVKNWQFEHRLGAALIDKNNQLILAFQGYLARFNFENEQIEKLCEIEGEIINNRPNDGKIGPDGYLWQGTMEVNCEDYKGSLYRIDNHFNIQKKLNNLSVSNGMAWSLNNEYFYHIDSPTQQIKKYKFNAKTGEITFEKIAITIPAEIGQPDGMSIDNEGMLWIAIWGGFCVKRYNPENGNLLETIKLPAPHITSCAFGGKNMDTLFITSAREGMSADELIKYPESGNLFVQKVNVKGQNSFKFGITYY